MYHHKIHAGLLHVIAVISNPEMWKSRYTHYMNFRKHMQQSGVHLITVEHAFGKRPFEVTTKNYIDDVQVRGTHTQEIWLKEALANHAIRTRLTTQIPDWEYVALIDADTWLLRPDWAEAVVHELQHSPVCQIWSTSIDLGPKYELIPNEGGDAYDRSFAAAYAAGDAHIPGTRWKEQHGPCTKDKYDLRQHYGYGWAFTRQCYDGMGGFIDWAITGPGDYHMAYAFAGIELPPDVEMSEGYNRKLKQFYDRVQPVVQRRLGVVQGTIAHSHHGNKKFRKYTDRRQILIGPPKYDPDTDLAYDAQGLPYVCSDNWKLLADLRKYFQGRNEDSIDV